MRKVLISLGVLGAASLGALFAGGCSAGSSCVYEHGPGGEPAWSPDGRRVAFLKGIDIYVINFDGTNLRRLTRGSCYGFSSPSWSPDSKRIVVEADDEEVGVADTMSAFAVLDVRTGRRRGDPVEVGGFDPSLSPDGRWIATGGESPGGGVNIYRLDGSVRWLTDRAAKEPRWSPSGREIVFAGDRGLYTVPVRKKYRSSISRTRARKADPRRSSITATTQYGRLTEVESPSRTTAGSA